MKLINSRFAASACFLTMLAVPASVLAQLPKPVPLHGSCFGAQHLGDDTRRPGYRNGRRRYVSSSQTKQLRRVDMLRIPRRSAYSPSSRVWIVGSWPLLEVLTRA